MKSMNLKTFTHLSGIILTVLFTLSLSPFTDYSYHSVALGSTDSDEKDASESKNENSFKLGNLIPKDFNPPATLQQLDKIVQDRGGWIENPLRDGDELLFKYLNSEKPPLSVEEARKLKNTDEKTNQQIVSTLCRLPDDMEKGGESKQVDYSAQVIRHISGDASTFIPIMGSSVSDFDVSELLSIGIFSFTYDSFETYAPRDVDVSWHSSKDHLIDKVVLRDDLTWSDGHPLTAYDIEFTYQVIMTEAVPVPAMRNGTDRLLGVKAYDAHTIVFFHREAKPTNVFDMIFSIIPKHIYSQHIAEDPTLNRHPEHVKLEDNPVVAGPYTVESRKRGREIILKRREGYYMHNGKQVRTKPFFECIRFKISAETASALMQMKKGDIEIMQLTPELWTTQTNDQSYLDLNTKATAEEWTYFAFWWNLKDPLFQDKRVREALGYAFNHDELMKTYCYGLNTQCTGIFHPKSPWYPSEPTAALKRDVQKANKLLNESGWLDTDHDGIRDKEGFQCPYCSIMTWRENLKDQSPPTIKCHACKRKYGTPWAKTAREKILPCSNLEKKRFEFTMITNNRAESVAIVMLLKSNLREVGIQCNVQPLEFTVLIQKQHDKKFQASLGGWGSGADPSTSVNVWGSGETRNYIGYSNSEVDRLFRLGEREFDYKKRMEIYGKIHTLIYEDVPCTWLYNRNAYYGFNRMLRGFAFYPRGPIYSASWKEIRNAQE